MDGQTWAGAASEVWRSAFRHKLAAVIIAVCVAGSLAAIALAGSVSTSPHSTDPAAPMFSVPALSGSGHQVSLADYQGKPVIVNFFASSCASCQRETPLLARFYRTEKARVALVGLDEADERDNAISFTRSDGVSYPVGWDPQVIVADSYGVNALPQTFFLNARHRVVDHIFGAATLAELDRGIKLSGA